MSNSLTFTAFAVALATLASSAPSARAESCAARAEAADMAYVLVECPLPCHMRSPHLARVWYLDGNDEWQRANQDDAWGDCFLVPRGTKSVDVKAVCGHAVTRASTDGHLAAANPMVLPNTPWALDPPRITTVTLTCDYDPATVSRALSHFIQGWNPNRPSRAALDRFLAEGGIEPEWAYREMLRDVAGPSCKRACINGLRDDQLSGVYRVLKEPAVAEKLRRLDTREQLIDRFIVYDAALEPVRKICESFTHCDAPASPVRMKLDALETTRLQANLCPVDSGSACRSEWGKALSHAREKLEHEPRFE